LKSVKLDILKNRKKNYIILRNRGNAILGFDAFLTMESPYLREIGRRI